MKLKHLFENEVPNITNPREAYMYAEKQGRRIPELEPIIMKDPEWAYYYAVDVIKGRWPEAEHYIISLRNPFAAELYLSRFPEARNPSKHIPLVIVNYAFMDIPNTISDEQTLKLISLICELSSLTIYSIKQGRVYFEPTIEQELESNKLIKINNIKDLKGAQLEHFKKLFIEQSDFE